MNKLIVTRWSDQQGEVDLTESSILERHQPSENYRITPSKYPPGTAFAGTSREGTLYVLEGRCRISSGEDHCVVSEGDVVHIPSGDYQLETLGDDELHTVKVWRLPEKFRVQSARTQTTQERIGQDSDLE